MREGQDIALICENGHMITDSSKAHPENNSKMCKSCGAKCINSCPECDAIIKGKYHYASVVSFSTTPVPAYCDNCGAPYPWTKIGIESLEKLIRLTDLEPSEKDAFINEVSDIITDTPKTKSAIAAVKILLSKIGNGLRDDIKDVIADIGAEVVKESLGIKR